MGGFGLEVEVEDEGPPTGKGGLEVEVDVEGTGWTGMRKGGTGVEEEDEEAMAMGWEGWRSSAGAEAGASDGGGSETVAGRAVLERARSVVGRTEVEAEEVGWSTSNSIFFSSFLT